MLTLPDGWTIVSHDDPVLREHYADILVAFPNAVICLDGGGVLRFRQSALARWIGNHISLNEMVIDCQRGEFPIEELIQFYMDMGYSLSGFVDVFGDEITALVANREKSHADRHHVQLDQGKSGWC